MTFLILIFFISLYLILHTYIIYPLSIKILTIFYRKTYKVESGFLPKVSILISVYNEELVIINTLKNFLQQDYPKDKFEIIIGSDGSTDKTNKKIQQFAIENNNIAFIPFEKRRGKKFVINDLAKIAKGEILIFSDSNTIYESDAIRHLVKFYNDDRVGGVSGRLELVDVQGATEKSNKEATYWKYESWIKDIEGRLGALIGANGGIYSIRKKLFIEMPSDISVVDDLYLSLKVLEQGKDFVYCKEALATETLAPSVKWEFERKVRIVPRGFETIKQVKKLLFNKRFNISYGIWSHKLIRWITPLLFIILFLSNILIFLIQTGTFYALMLAFQLMIIVFGITGYFLSKRNFNFKIFQLPFYFLVTNYALLKGLYRYITKKHKPTWEPTPR